MAAITADVALTVEHARRVEPQPPTQLTAGQTVYEGPNDVHVVDRGANTTEPGQFVVFMIKGGGAPALVPAERLPARVDQAGPAPARPVKRGGRFSRKAAAPSARSGVRAAIAWFRASIFRTSSSDMPSPW